MRGEFAVVGSFVLLGSASLLTGSTDGSAVDFSLGRTLPSPGHWLGTDHAGRDLLKRLVEGAGRLLLPGLLGAVVVLGGVPVGALAGWRSPRRRTRWSGALVRGALTLVLAVPAALPAYVLLLLFGLSFGFHPVAIGLLAGALGAAELAEALRTRIAEASRAEFVASSLADGLSEGHVLGNHLVWLQGRGLVLRHVVACFPRVLLVEAALSCLPPGGYGVKEPLASWGNMLVRPMRELVVAAPGGAPAALVWNALLPTACLAGSVAAFGWLGDRFSRRAEGSS